MSTRPKSNYVRRAELIEWLTAEGFGMRDIRAWIAADIIRKHTFGQAKAKNPRAYYRVEQVVAALKLDEPISNSPTQKTPCPK